MVSQITKNMPLGIMNVPQSCAHTINVILLCNIFVSCGQTTLNKTIWIVINLVMHSKATKHMHRSGYYRVKNSSLYLTKHKNWVVVTLFTWDSNCILLPNQHNVGTIHTDTTYTTNNALKWCHTQWISPNVATFDITCEEIFTHACIDFYHKLSLVRRLRSLNCAQHMPYSIFTRCSYLIHSKQPITWHTRDCYKCQRIYIVVTRSIGCHFQCK